MKGNKLIKGALVAAMLGLSSGVMAASVPAEQIFSVTVDGSAQSIGGVFGLFPDDLWGFTLSSAGHTETEAANFGINGPSGMTVELYKDVNSDWSLDSGDSLIQAMTGSAVEMMAYLAGTPAQYILRIGGVNGEGYLGHVEAVSSVPLPGAAILFGSALLGAGVAGRKKIAAKRAELVAA